MTEFQYDQMVDDTNDYWYEISKTLEKLEAMFPECLVSYDDAKKQYVIDCK